jgi:RHS repeat-associated protein
VSSVSQSSVSYTYNPTTLALDTETITYTLPGQPAFTRVLDRSQDTLGRESGWELKNGATTENSVRYDYSLTDGRLSSISNPQLSNVSFAYGYETGSSLVKTVTGPAHTVTNTYEPNRDILDVKENKAGTTTVSKYDYLVNAIGQRSNVAQTGTAFAGSRDIAWAYDPLGQVTSADSTIPGLDRAYAFDMIGNRLKTADSLTLPAANNYTPNALNQYTAIGSLNPVHDDDGNMTAGPLPANVNANSTLVWDGENRLIQAQVTGGATVNFIYDSQSRRIAETVGTNTKLTVYDGWNPIAEYAIQNSTFTIQNSYLWGLDLSGSMQGAGGVGGLLAVTDSTGTYYPTYDGNGNVSEYLDSTGTVVAHYEYDPFGKTTVATGAKAQDFSHRFSTKPLDITTGLYYYGYRYYDPITGRWPSRDPIEEIGGVNLYGFVYNSPLSWIDLLGLRHCPCGANIGEEIVVDDAGEECCNDEIQEVRLRMDVGDIVGHAFIVMPDGTGAGFYPEEGAGGWDWFTNRTEPGSQVDDRNHPWHFERVYKVCPKTLSSLESSIDEDDGDYGLSNINAPNCVGWACGRLNDAGLTPPHRPDLPRITPHSAAGVTGNANGGAPPAIPNPQLPPP